MSTDNGLYKPTDLAELKRRLAAKESKGSNNSDNDLKWYKFPSGTERVVVRYLPSLTGVPGKIVKKHHNLPEIKDILCFRTHDMDCPLCELLHQYSDKMDVSDWVANSRSYMNALILEDPTQKNIDPKTPHIVGQGEGNLYWVFSKITDPDIGDICDPFTGFNVAYHRTEFNGKFERTVLPKARPIANTKEEVESILGKISDLDKIWRRPDDVFLKKIQDVTEKLKVVIDQRLVTLSSQPDAGQKESQSAMNQNLNNTPAPSTTSASPAPSAAPKSNKPANSPDCFADAKVFYKNEATGEDDHSKQKCVSCPFDFHCGESIKK